MRTSNKILLGIFIGPLIILTALQLTLYAKYKSGNYIAMKIVKEERFIKKSFKNINFIKVYGVNNFRIISSDSCKLEYEKDAEGRLGYLISGDSLIIRGDTVRTGAPGENARGYQSVNLYLPASANIMADNTDVFLQGSKDSLHAKSYHFSIVNSASLKIEENGVDSNHTYFNQLTIQSFHSAGIELTGNTRVADLQLNMLESGFTDNGASIDKLMIDADKESNISLKGDNLKKVNVVKQP